MFSRFRTVDVVMLVFTIVLLAAVLFPVFSQAREGKRRSALTHVKQVNMGVFSICKTTTTDFHTKHNVTTR